MKMAIAHSRGDERLVVGGGDDLRSRALRCLHDTFRGDFADVVGGFIRCRVAQCLRGEPVLAVAAVEITAEHAEGEGDGPGQEVVEGFFLDRVGVETGDIAPGDAQLPAVVEAHLADAAPTRTDQAAVGAGGAAQGAIRLGNDQFRRGGVPVEQAG